MTRTLVFTHANSFPGGTYRKLFAAFAQAGWRVLAPERLAHDGAFPVASGWRPSRDELIAFIERSGVATPVHLVGHSLGGYLSLMVASRRSDLAASVVMLDSPVLAGWRAHGVRVAKAMRLIGRVSPARVSSRRRRHWGDADELAAYLRERRAFSRWDAEVLADYRRAGFEPDPAGGLRLAFHRDVETRLYNTLPHDLGRLLRRHPPRCPVSFIGGTVSAEIRRAGLAATRALVRDRIDWIAGSHLFPMERPLETAAAVLRRLEQSESIRP